MTGYVKLSHIQRVSTTEYNIEITRLRSALSVIQEQACHLDDPARIIAHLNTEDRIRSRIHDLMEEQNRKQLMAQGLQY